MCFIVRCVRQDMCVKHNHGDDHIREIIGGGWVEAKIKESVKIIIETLKGEKAPDGTGGDFSFIVYPLPKIALCYIFYEADEDFPPSVTCLYSNNARLFLPVDGLADVGEYCSKTILTLIETACL